MQLHVYCGLSWVSPWQTYQKLCVLVHAQTINEEDVATFLFPRLSIKSFTSLACRAAQECNGGHSCLWPAADMSDLYLRVIEYTQGLAAAYSNWLWSRHICDRNGSEIAWRLAFSDMTPCWQHRTRSDITNLGFLFSSLSCKSALKHAARLP